MMFVILALVLGIVLYLVPTSAPPANAVMVGKVNTFGLVLIFWSVFFIMAAYGGKTVRVADAAHENRQGAVDHANVFGSASTYELAWGRR